MDMQTAFTEYFTENLPAMLDRLKELVEHETPSTDKPALDEMARRLKSNFQEAGAEVSIVSNKTRGDQVVAVYAADYESPDTRSALILSHSDTVWPSETLAARPFQVEQNKAFGPGIFDMKTSIVMAEFVLRAIRDLGLILPRPVTLLVTSDEELGSPTSRELVEAHAREAEYALVLESPLPGGVLKTARKGVGYFLLEIEGRAAHAGIDPERGSSAISELAQQILRLNGLADASRGSTVNVGVVGGGSRLNVIPACARAEIDVRVSDVSEAGRIKDAILESKPLTPGTRIRVEGGFKRPPMERSSGIGALFERAKEIGNGLGLALEEGSTGGGSDGNFCASLGLPTLDGLGTLGDGAHADHEHIYVDSIPSRSALLLALLLNL